MPHLMNKKLVQYRAASETVAFVFQQTGTLHDDIIGV